MKTLRKKFKKNKRNGLVLAGIILSFVSYSYAIADTTMSISSSRMMSQDLQELQTEIAELELAFFEAIDDFSVDTALSYGLSETKFVYYADQNEPTTVAFNNNI